MANTILIFSTKGGVGKTLIAVNLAVSLNRDQMKKVCIVDLDLQGAGDMAKMLNASPHKAMVDLIQLFNKESKFIKKEDVVMKTSSGIDFLPGILRPQQISHLDPNRIKDIFSLLENDYDYIIVDAGNVFNDVFVAALNQANLILLTVTPDILSIYQTRWAIDTLQFLHFPISMIKVILNRAESVSGISWQEVKVSLPVEVIAQVPSEGKVVGEAINRGIPVMLDNSRSRFALAIQNFSRDLVLGKDIFTKHIEVSQIEAGKLGLGKSVDFWQKKGMTEPLSRSDQLDEKDEIVVLKRKVHARLIEGLNLKRMDSKTFDDAKAVQDLKVKAEVMVTNFIVEEAGSFISSGEIRKKLVKEIVDEALGLGPLEDLLADPTITDIMVNNKDEIYIERSGKIEFANKKFMSNDQVRAVIERIIAPIGRRIDESVPMVDARLTDGSRVNAIIPPLSLTGPTLTIRKFRKEKYKVEDLVAIKSLSHNIGEFLKACVVCRKNVIVSGGTGSGKTTMLNVISEFIPQGERVVTIEDAAELRLQQRHWIRLESRSPNIEGKGAITIRDLFRNTLRMRPDRVIVGECRGAETLDMLQAMNTGHDGSMTTMHANSTQDVLSRMDSMILMSGVELPIRSIREMVTSAIDIIVHTSRFSDGSRKIAQISEIVGMQNDGRIALKDLFVFKQVGITAQGGVLGDFHATGNIPSFIEELKVKGILLPEDTFKAS